jgi:hypothetical protein
MRSHPRAVVLGVILAAPLTVQASLASECVGLRPETKSAWEAALKQSDEGHALWATGDASAIKKCGRKLMTSPSSEA